MLAVLIGSPFLTSIAYAAPGALLPDETDTPVQTRTLESGLLIEKQAAVARTLVIDPGHGGTDAGCTGEGGLVEKEWTLALSEMLALKAEKALGLTVSMTRTDDRTASVNERRRLARQKQPDLFISIHVSASFSKSAHGLSVFCPKGSPKDQRTPVTSGTGRAAASLRLGEEIAKSVGAAANMACTGVFVAPCAAFEDLEAPSVLLEVGHVTNPTEEALMLVESHREKIVAGIVDGIRAFLSREGAKGEPNERR